MSRWQPAPAREQLLARVYRHFPRGIPPEDLRHGASEESRRLACTLEAAAIACQKEFVPVPDENRVTIDAEVALVIDTLGAWPRFVSRCERDFPDRIVWDESGPFFDPGYRVSVAQQGYLPPPWTPHPDAREQPRTLPIPPPDHPDSSTIHDPVLCMVSVLAPIYTIFVELYDSSDQPTICYSEFPDRYHDRIDKLCTLAEEVFGFSRMDPDTLLSPLPDVKPESSKRDMQDTILADCLFTTLG